jgi:hypothetical protein
MKRTWVPPLSYALALVPLVIGAHAAAAGAFAIYAHLPDGIQRSDWIGVILNDVAPGSAGVICAGTLAMLLARRGTFSPTLPGFVWRTLPWLILAGVILLIVNYESANSDFGLWSQVITWPLAALLAGLVTDAIMTWRRASLRLRYNER